MLASDVKASASASASCCTKTYFTSNSDKSLLCRFDPRLSTSSLPAAGSHSSTANSWSRTSASHASRLAPAAFVHQLAPAMSPSPPVLVHSPAVAILSEACLYPTLTEATLASSASSVSTSSSSSSRHFTGFWDAVVKIVRNEGASALWRGTGPALAMSVPGQVIYMVGYDWGRRTSFYHAPAWAYARPYAVGTDSSPQLASWYLTAVPLVAGSLSRTLVAALTSPLELIRTRLQSTSERISVASIVRSLQAQGLASAWRGLPPTLWRDVPFSGIYWAAYEGIKRGLTGGRGMGEGSATGGIGREFGVAFVSGAGSGMVSDHAVLARLVSQLQPL